MGLAYQPFKTNYKEDFHELRLGRIDGGLNLKYIESQINDNQSPLMQNLNADDRGALVKRKGQLKVFSNSLGPGAVNGLFYYKDKRIIAHGTKLYTQTGSDQPVEILNGLANQKGSPFVFNELLYYINGTDYIQYDGITAKAVVPYIPTLTLGRAPSGGGTANEQFNLLGGGFKDSFSGTVADTVYQLSLTGLDATLAIAYVNGVKKDENIHFTVDRVNGRVTFTAAPGLGTNNVVITAYKTLAGFSDRVKKNKYVIDYGGANDTRLFFAGNTDYPNRYIVSGLYDASYWPENTYNDIGSTNEAITGFSKQHDILVVFKEKSIYKVVYQLNQALGFWDSAGTVVSYFTQPINSAVGCDMPWTIQLIDNNPVFCNTYGGVYILLLLEKNERNCEPLSGNINGVVMEGRPGVLDEDIDDLKAASSVDYGEKYWLCVGNKVWVWDYRLSPYEGNYEVLSWFPYTNINANSWLIMNLNEDKTLYFGDRADGIMQKFVNELNDNGAAIEAVWRSKMFSFNLPDFIKTITEIWINSRPTRYSVMTIKYFNEYEEILDASDIVLSSFSWFRFVWDGFTWDVPRFPVVIKRKPKVKKVVYFQIEMSNSEPDQNLSILNMVIRYLVNRKVK